MRSCRRFLAGIPHLRVGHPRATHPSATPSHSEKCEDVRLACVRHAASVYPEPGSNSPSNVYLASLPLQEGGQMHCSARSRPSYSYIKHLACSQILNEWMPCVASILVDRSLLLPTVAARSFCFPLFNCQGTSRSKRCLLLCCRFEDR